MKRIVILIILVFALNLMGWVTETGTLEEFVYGENSELEYDNWLSHVVEYVSDPGYNLYAPYDRQLNGFGNYTVPTGEQLEAWRTITTEITHWNYELADSLILATGLPFKLVEFNDTVSGNVYWIIREDLNPIYVDDNGTPDWDGDDERGSFDYGWGMYIFNPLAAYPVVITSPHNTDDYFTLPFALKIFRESNAYVLLASGVGRETYWDNPYGTNYGNSYSLCDPTREEDTMFNSVYQASCDYMRETYGHRELSIQVHSYDWNRHLWYPNCQISAGYGKSDPGIPIRDYSQYGWDIINQGNPIMLAANEVGIHPAVHLNEFYGVNYSNFPFYYTNEDTTFSVNNSVDLVGYRYNRQMVYTCSGLNDHLTFEPFFHIEMDELPNVYPQSVASLNWFWGYDPITQRFDYDHLFDRAFEYYGRWTEDLAAVIPTIFEFDDDEIPTSTEPLEILSRNYDRVELSWQRTNCYDYDTYEVLYSQEPIANGNYEIWDRGNDADFNNAAGTWTVITGLDYNSEYFFQMRVLDANGNYSELSNEVSCLTAPARLRYEKAVARDGYANFSFNAYRQEENAGFLIYRKADNEDEYTMVDSWMTNPFLVALNDIDDYTYNWTDSLVTNWTEYAYIAASSDSMGNEYWHNYPAYATPFDIYTIHFMHEDSLLTDDIWFGACPQASNSWDADYDIEQDETSSGDYVFAEFYEEDWDNHGSMIRQIEGGYNFDTTLKSWVFRVKSNQLNDDITSSAQGQFIRDGRKLYLIDQASGSVIDFLAEDYTYTVTNGGWRLFTLYWGNITPSVEFTNPASHIYQAGDVVSFSWSIDRSYLVTDFDLYIVSPTETLLIGESMLPFFNQTNWQVPDNMLLEDAHIMIDLEMIDGDRHQYTSGFKFGCVPSTYALAVPAGWHLIANPFLGASSIDDMLGEDADIYSLEYNEYQQDIAFFYGTGYFLESAFGNISIIEEDIQGGNEQFALQTGWNIVPNPYLSGFRRDDLRIISPNLEMTFTEAVQYDLIESAIYSYDRSWHEIDYVYPTEAFLLYCREDGIQIKFIPYNNNNYDLVTEDYDLKVRLLASQENGAEDEMILALNPAATPGYDKLYDLPEPHLTPADNNLSMFTIIDTAASFTNYNQNTLNCNDILEARIDWDFSIVMQQTETFILALDENELPQDVVVIVTIDGVEYDLSRDGDLEYEPAESVVNGMISFVPVWMSDTEDNILPVLSVMNYPNPFYYGNTRSDGINISFNIPQADQVKLCIYNIKGQKVTELVDDHYEAGRHTVNWNMKDSRQRDIASGVYFSRVEANGSKSHAKLVIIK
ncbi:MAG: T9SS type A sorting domain-containing protein [Candidatus Cloacimonetes bacterium]|nr:T9SS type A sorting domain-containing protein [Candidatus Cloacimonadota bacterium]